MVRKVSFVVFLCLSYSTTSYAFNQEKEPHPTLEELLKGVMQPNSVGGVRIPNYEVPWIVAIFRLGKFVCAGTILSKDYVLTTTACLELGNVRYYQVVAGESYLGCREGGEMIYNVKKIEHNPNYGLAMIKLNTPIQFNRYIKPIQIVARNYTMPATGQTALMAGWGRTKDGDPLSTGLRMVNVSRNDQRFCENLESAELLGKHAMCFGTRNQSACGGDEGSPLMCGDTRALCGVVVYTLQCTDTRYPDVYVNIQMVRPWLLQAAEMDAPEDRWPFLAIKVTTKTPKCYTYEEDVSSATITFENITDGYICNVLVKAKYKEVRYRITYTDLLLGDALTVSAACDGCDIVELSKRDVNYYTTQSSLIIITLYTHTVLSRFRSVVFEMFASGYPDYEKKLTFQNTFRAPPGPSTCAYHPLFGSNLYNNNENNLFIFTPEGEAGKDLKIYWELFDMRDNPETCKRDYVELYYSETIPKGKHRLFKTLCGSTRPSNHTWPYGRGFIRFYTDGSGVGNGFNFKYYEMKT